MSPGRGGWPQLGRHQATDTSGFASHRVQSCLLSPMRASLSGRRGPSRSSPSPCPATPRGFPYLACSSSPNTIPRLSAYHPSFPLMAAFPGPEFDLSAWASGSPFPPTVVYSSVSAPHVLRFSSATPAPLRSPQLLPSFSAPSQLLLRPLQLLLIRFPSLLCRAVVLQGQPPV